MPNQSANIINSYDFFYKVEELCRNYEEGETLEHRLMKVYDEYSKLFSDKTLKYTEKLKVTIKTGQAFKNISSIIKECANLFENGNIQGSYTNMWRVFNNKSLNSALYMTKRTRDPLPYYRGRLKSSEPIKDAKDLFHVPFEKRHLVSTARFSMPGYPCLYLTRRIYTIWKELPNCRLEDLYVSRLRYQYINENNQKNPLCLLDLRLRCRLDSTQKLRVYLQLMPLIIACSLKVQHPNAPYKQEYVIPQIVMHLLMEKRNNNKISKCDGIIYSSTNDDHNYWANTNMPPSTDCVVVPVQKISDKRYCPILAKMFKISDPISFDTQLYHGWSGNNTTYAGSIFAQLEQKLSKITLKKIS